MDVTEGTYFRANLGAQERMLTGLNQRLRDVRLGPDGFIYLLTDETAGAILRLEPGSPAR